MGGSLTTKQEKEEEKVMDELDSKILDILVDIQLNKNCPEVQELLHLQLTQCHQRRRNLAMQIEKRVIDAKKKLIMKEITEEEERKSQPIIREED